MLFSILKSELIVDEESQECLLVGLGEEKTRWRFENEEAERSTGCHEQGK